MYQAACQIPGYFSYLLIKSAKIPDLYMHRITRRVNVFAQNGNKTAIAIGFIFANGF
jgi:hypothetical protein